MKRKLTALLLIALLLCSVGATAETRSKWAHIYRFGDREQPRVAVTVDDWIHPDEWLMEFLAVAEQYKVKLTLYPSGYALKPEDREIWQAALDAGHEIGCHFFQHKRLTQRSQAAVKRDLEKYQKALDDTLVYHYEFLTVRPPFGAGMTSGGSAQARWIHNVGFDHIVLWDMDNTSNLDKALKTIKNGSIILVHANHHDLVFLGKLLEALQERNYEYLTVSELLNIKSRYYYVDE